MKKKIITLVIATTLSMSPTQSKHNLFEDLEEWAERSSKLLEKTRRDIDEIFGRFTTYPNSSSAIKQINIFETKSGKEWGMEFKLPGFKKEDIKIKIDESGYLHINAKSNKKNIIQEKNNRDKNYIYKSKSFESTQFSQRIKLPQNIEYKEPQKINVKYDEKSGILEIRFPKKNAPKEIVKEIELKLK